MIKLEALRVFVTVAETGNIKDAADTIGRTASAVSMTLKQLEEDIGGPLFQTDRKNSLTALGSLMLDLGLQQIKSFDKSVGMMRAFAQNKIGSLSIAAVPSVAANVIPRLLPQFIASRPQVQVEMFDIDSAQVRRMVEAGIADLGFAGEPKIRGGLEVTPLFVDRFKLLCPESSTLAALGRPVRWADLASEILIRNGASDKIEAEEYRAMAQAARITVYNVTSLMALVKAGVGITLLPALTTLSAPAGVAVLDLEDDRLSRSVGLIERPGTLQSPVAKAFRAHVLARMSEALDGLGVRPTL